MDYKIVLCGDGYVGKTALRRRYMGVGFNPSYFMTLGADLSLQSISLPNRSGKIIPHKFQIWDLTGQHSFKSVRPMYYSGANSAIIVYDVTQPSSFQNVINWVSEVKDHANEFLVSIILLANKIDLKDQADAPVGEKEGKGLSEELSTKIFNDRIKIHFMETSAKTGENVDQAFMKIVEETHKLIKSSEKREIEEI
ncbi:MAG: GTP-binding protein [Candidatus Hodarchaeales archaeon]|jgi:small GTP-binding protein